VKPGEVARNFSRGAFFLGLEKGIGLISTLAYSALIARWLGPTKYGMFTLAFSIVTLATAFTGNFEVYLERYAAEYQVRDRLRTLRRAYGLALGLKLALGLGACAVLLALAPRFASTYRIPELAVLLPLLTAFIATDGLATTGRSLLFGLQHFEWVSGLSLIMNLGRTVLVAVLWRARQGLPALAIGLSALTVIQAIVTCIAALALLAHARSRREVERGEEPPLEGGLLRQMVGYCMPLYGANLSFLSGQNLGKLVLGLVIDPTSLGYFSFAFGTLEKFIEIAHTVPRALLPSLTQLVALGDPKRLHYVFGQAYRLVLVLSCALSFGLFVYAREITLLIGSPLFEPAVPLLRVLALVPLARTAQQPLTMLFQAARRPGYVLSLALIKLLAEIAGYFVLLLSLGATGACWANVGGAVASFAGALVLATSVLPEGSRERVNVVLRGALLMLPALGVATIANHWLGRDASLVVRILLAGLAVLGVFALGLVTSYDLEKLSDLPLPTAALGRARDALVRAAAQLIRVLGERSAA